MPIGEPLNWKLKGRAVRALRHKLGISQERLASLTHVTVSTVNRWENGHAEPSKLATKAILSLAESYGVSRAELEAL